MTPTAGDLVHGYRIVGTLGRGGLGTTFEASNDETGARVALKVLAIAKVAEWKRVELFEREARVLARLDHPGIPRYIDHFTVDDGEGATLCIVQELVEGKSLAALVEDREVTVDEAFARSIGVELLGVLVYLGRQTPPVTHRDIKPENVLRRKDGSIALVDFGAARSELGKAGGGSTTVGTYGYMAPEQLHGVASPSTDIYGLACTLLFLLTGRAPTELPRKKLRIDFRGHVAVSSQFARWLTKALEPAPEDRFPSAEAALEVLRDDGSAKRARRRRVARVAAVALAVVMVGAASSYVISRSPAPPPVQPRRPAPVSCPKSLAAGLVGYWALDGDTRDLASGKEDLSVVHASKGAGDESAPFREGVIGMGLGASVCTTSYLCPNAAWLEASDPTDARFRFDAPTSDFTVSLWARRVTSPYADKTWWSYALLDNEQVYLGANGAGAGTSPAYPSLTLRGANGDIAVVDRTFDVRSPGHTGEWFHVVAFRRGDVAGLVVDGHETTARVSGALRPPGTFLLGAQRQGYPWQGQIDEVGKWSRALTEDEMRGLYEGGPCRPAR